MRSRAIILSLILLLLLLTGCGSQRPATLTPGSATPTEIGSLTSTITPTVTPMPRMEAPSYQLDLQLDYDASTANVHEVIQYQNQSGETMKSLVLAVEPNLWSGCFSLQSLKVNGQAATSFNLVGQQLELPVSLLPLDEVKLEINYTLALPRIEVDKHAFVIRTQLFGYTTKQLNLVEWYPFIVPYIPGEGWVLHKPASYGEHLVYDSADFEVNLALTGKTVPQVATSGNEMAADQGKHYQMKLGRTFAMSFSPEYLVKTGQVDGMDVISYYFPGSALGAQAALDATLRAVHTFNQDFIPYQHPTLTIVQEDGDFSMEFDGLYFLETPLYVAYSGVNTDFLPTIAAHETAHQWWFGLVGTDQAMQPWLDESLATYSERLFNETYGLERGNWWYLARLSEAENRDCPVDIIIYGFYPNKCYYTESVYMRGGLFLQALRDRLGDQAFLAFLKDFATQYTHKHASTQDFFTVLRQHTDADLGDIISRFFTEAH